MIKGNLTLNLGFLILCVTKINYKNVVIIIIIRIVVWLQRLNFFNVPQISVNEFALYLPVILPSLSLLFKLVIQDDHPILSP